MRNTVTQELLKRVTEGDELAFQSLYEETKTHVYQMVMMLADRKDDAGDIMSEIYIELLRSIPRYDGSLPFQPWFNALIARQVSNCNRKWWRIGRLFARAEQFHDLNQASENTEQTFFRGEQRRELKALLERLPYKQRIVVILKYFNDYTFEEISQILNIPAGTARSRHHKALQNLREMNQLDLKKWKEEVTAHGCR